ncbi:MAG: AraC family transcriptional regulator [Myxococcales bacterium]|nr:AraC family transcriptional regulator [Myxococcales bacterium]
MHEDFDIPAQRYGRLWFRDGIAPMSYVHRHAELEVNLVVRGSGSYRVWNRRYDIHRHSIFWLFPEQEHTLCHTSEDFVMWVWIIKQDALLHLVSPEATKVLRHGNPPGHFCRALAPNDTRLLAALLQQVFTHQAHDDVFNSGLLHATATAWMMYSEGPGAGPAGTALHPAVEQVVELLSTREMDLPTLARKTRQNPSYLSRLFHQQMGVRLVEFRNRMRIQRFLEAYGHGKNLTMLAAALAAGFGSYPQFNRVFRELMGVAPRTYLARTNT